jgi:hypothetical protein
MPFVLIIAERGHSWAGRPPIVTSHETRAAAEADLVSYVRERWAAEMDGGPVPEDDDEMIEQYFDFALERYEIVEAPANT